jgi:hypothetical protein
MIYETNLEGLSLARSLKQLDCVLQTETTIHTRLLMTSFTKDENGLGFVVFFKKKNISFLIFFHITKQIK